MKRITNILSYLCLLLLLLVVACSDLEEIVVNMQGEEEVELTIQTNIPSLGGSTRTAPTENITSITALAFDSDHELIKVAIEDVEDVKITPSASPSTSGTYTVKVPVRTRRIHFIAKNDDNPNDETDVEFTEITNDDYGKSDEELLKDRLTSELHYWGKLDFEDAEDLKSGRDVTLYRNMAMLKLDTGSENDDYIAGLIHYNSKGTIAPYITTNSDDEAINDFGYQDGISHYIPKDDNGVSFITTDTSDKNYGKVHYLFEEFNKKSDGFGEESDIVYVICNIGNKFYKVAFKPTSSSTDFYYIIRNKQYTIKIKEGATLSDAYAATEYEDALDLAPINNTKEVDIEILEEMDVYMFVDETGTATLNIPAGMTQLEIGYSQDNFAQGGVNVTNIAPNSKSELEVTSENENGQSETIRLWIDAYKESLPEEQTTWTLNIQLKEEYINEVIESGDPSILEIQFLGEGTGMKLNQKLNVHIMLRGTLGVTSAVSLPNKVGSEFKQVVNIPDFGGYDENFKLKVDDVESKYTITAPEGLQLVEDANGNYYEVEEDSQYTFTFALKDVGEVGDKHEIKFTATSEYHELTGTTTVTLVDDVPDQDVYEIWVGDGNAWTGTTNSNSVEFFGYKTTADSNGFEKNTTPPTGFRTTFYDALTVNSTTYSADNHIQQAMVMGSDDSFTFTIPEGSNRWLTLLVANDGDDSDTPSIQLSNGSDWTTAGNTVDLTNGTYNFGAKGEITTAGRLIRYELPAGTYTLKGSDADYLLYYMRVSKARPEMTDVAQPQLADYNLSWSGGDYANTTGKGYLKISDSKHIVDEDNLTHTVSLKADNSLEESLNLSNYTLSTTFDLYITQPTYTFVEPDDENNNIGSITIGDDKLDGYKNIVPSSELPLEKNGGDYVLSGKIIEPDYKYSAFYDVLQLNQVKYEVKNPIVPALYNSMDGDKLTPVENWTTMDDAWAIGFFMPSPMPIEYATPSDRPEIAISIPGWTKSDSGTSSGLGVVVDSENKIYTLKTQDNSVHPRPGWTYKIQWADRASSTISPEIVDQSSDVYFTYMGNIAKKVDVAVPEIEETSLNITLDFYADNGAAFNDLKFGETKFYLKATIPSNIPAGKQILLNLATSEGRSGINEHQSRNAESSNGISYHYNDSEVVDGLVITTVENQTDYLMCWQYVRSDANNTNDVTITYTVSSDKHTLTNETQASITIKNEPTNAEPTDGEVIWNDGATLTWENYITINRSLPAGTQITLNFTTTNNGGKIEIHNLSQQSFRPDGITSDRFQPGDDCFDVRSGETSISFTLLDAMDGFMINGNDVTLTSIVVTTPSAVTETVIFDCNFDDDIEGFYVSGKGSVERVDNALALSSNDDYDDYDELWAAQAMKTTDKIEYGATYTLTFKAKIANNTTQGAMAVAIQRFENGECVATDHYRIFNIDDINNAEKDNQDWAEFTYDIIIQDNNQETPNKNNPTHFMFNFGDLVGKLYIDDLRLVKKN